MKNEYRIEGDLLYIKLKRRDGTETETVTDAKFLPKLMEWNCQWYPKFAHKNQQFYPQASKYLGKNENGNSKMTTVYMHKYILDSPTEEFIDHINHDSLDNRECNLRRTNNQQNCLNRKGANRNTSTGVRNVFWSEQDKRYVLTIQVNGKARRFGTYEDLELAEKVAEVVRDWYYKIG